METRERFPGDSGGYQVGALPGGRGRREAVEVVLRAFAHTQGMERHLTRCVWRSPGFKPEHTRVTVAHGRVVSVVSMTPRVVRFGSVTVPAMTVGPVATHPRYRKRGYGAAAMDDASRYMEATGCLVAYLGGIPDFYYRFGYYPYMARPVARFGCEDGRREADAGRVRALTRRDLARVRKVFDQVAAGRTCAAVRTGASWAWLTGPASHTCVFPGPKVILDGRGRVCGYLTLASGEGMSVPEIVVRQDQRSCRAAVGALVRLATRRKAKEIALPLPWDDALSVFLRQHVRTTFTMPSNPTGGAVMKIVDWPRLARRLQPLFTQRRRQAGTLLRAVRFTIETAIGSVGMDVGRDRVRVGDPGPGPTVRIPVRWLAGMLTGYHAVREIAPKPDVVVPPDLVGVLGCLFPAGWPFVYRGDSL